MAINMLNSRLNELRQTANPPFTGAGAGYGEYFLAKTKEAFSLTANSKIDGVDLAMKLFWKKQNVHVVSDSLKLNMNARVLTICKLWSLRITNVKNKKW